MSIQSDSNINCFIFELAPFRSPQYIINNKTQTEYQLSMKSGAELATKLSALVSTLAANWVLQLQQVVLQVRHDFEEEHNSR